MPVGVSGLTSDFDSQALIQKLVELERRPIKRLEEEKELYKLRIEVLEMMTRDFKRLRESTRTLFGPGTVLRKKTALGVDDSSFAVTPRETAQPGQYKMEVLRVAQAHSVSSDSFPSGTVFPAGSFKVRCSTNTRLITFPGGSADDLAAAINAQAGDIVAASAIRDTPETTVLQLLSRSTGKKNALSVSEDTGVLSAIAFLKPRNDTTLKLGAENSFEESSWSEYNGVRKSLAGLPGDAGFETDSFRVSQKAVELPVSEIPVAADTVLDITGTFETVPPETASSAGTSSAALEGIWSRLFPVRVKDIEIQGAVIPVNDSTDQPGDAAAQTPTAPDPDLLECGVGVAFVPVNAKKRVEKLFPLDTNATNGFNLSIPLDKGFEKINRVILYSPVTGRALRVTSLKIRSLSAGGLDFARTLQPPVDARFRLNDVEIERPSNTGIQDVIANTVLELRAPSQKPVTFTIDHAMSDIRREINSFISNYNACMDTLNQVAKTSKTERPGEYDRSEGGIFVGDMAFVNMRSKMRTIVSAAYPTSASNLLALPSQVGLSTGDWGSSFDEVRSGRLKFDPARFEEQLRARPQAVNELFGTDSDGDHRLDNGMAVRLDAFLFEVVRPKSGILDVKIEKTKEDVRTKNGEITKKEEQVQNYENNLKQRFGNMEQEMSGLNAQKKWMQQQQNSGRNQDE
jgi:flagellar hook-associated protein 2